MSDFQITIKPVVIVVGEVSQGSLGLSKLWEKFMEQVEVPIDQQPLVDAIKAQILNPSAEQVANIELAVSIYAKKGVTLTQAVLLASQILAESEFKADAVSPAGAVGLAQAMPDTWTDHMAGRAERTDPKKSIEFQIKYMRWIEAYLEKSDEYGDVTFYDNAVLYAYNWGIGNTIKYYAKPGSRRLPYETKRYVDTIHDYALAIAANLPAVASQVAAKSSEGKEFKPTS